ncbi:hypothetical protein B0H10DRAFT_1953809 [Mycena sp. CBHHK59/15]|nr:hypothetical protein B0H10DRAFT_1953809 [Mycena sp. CBHHK59/15]
MQNGSAVPPPIVMGVAQYGVLQKCLGPPRGHCGAFSAMICEMCVRGPAANFDGVGPIWLFTKYIEGLLKAIVQQQTAERGGGGIRWKQCRLHVVWDTYASAALSPHAHPLLLPYPRAISLAAMQTTPATHTVAPAPSTHVSICCMATPHPNSRVNTCEYVQLPSLQAYVGIGTGLQLEDAVGRGDRMGFMSYDFTESARHVPCVPSLHIHLPLNTAPRTFPTGQVTSTLFR